jgi:hypothetical protein
MERLNDALTKGDSSMILQMLKSPSLGIRGVKDENIQYYVQRLEEARDVKQVKYPVLRTTSG